MKIEIIKKEHQADGHFNGGEILEKKPIGFPQDGGKTKPYSNIFYWAHAWTPGSKSTIGLHPHQGFEICSFILEGSINHFDTKQEKWISLKKGDVQIIRAGSGISHAEELNDKSEIFQIWFDPNIQLSINEEASYDDYKSDEFSVTEREGIKEKKIAGEGSPMKIFSEGIEINSYDVSIGSELNLELEEDYVYSLFILEGTTKIEGQLVKKGDFVKVSNYKSLCVISESKTKIFNIKSPLRPSYSTYSERFMN